MSNKPRIDWKLGDTAVIKSGWGGARTQFTVLGPAVFLRQWWVPVAHKDEEDPDFFKEAGLDKKVMEYIPTSLRVGEHEEELKEVAYVIGQDMGYKRFEMWKGPDPSENAMLEVVGRSIDSVIIRYNADGIDDIIWRWKNDRWISQ